jgi:SEC-C motif-containing protein
MLHRGEAVAPSAVRLMRSRYSAFAVGDAQYLLDTWDASTRPRALHLDPDVAWYRLDIVQTVRGGMLDTEGTVEFRARYTVDGRPGEQREVSSFRRTGGRWYYVGVA